MTVMDINRPIIVNILTKGLDPSGNKPEVVPRWVILRYKTNQQVRWIIDKNVEFTIKFNKNGCPFGETEFNNERNESGPPTAADDPGDKDQFFYYSVEVEGFESIDPGVIIRK